MALAAAAGFTPDPWQEEFLRSPKQTRLLCCGRQVGKSTTAAMAIIQEMLKPDAMVVIIAPALRQSKELMRKVLLFWRLVGRPIKHVSATRLSLELVNGARLEAFPASSETIIGISAVTLLVIDEASVVPDELYHYVSPMLAASSGSLVALSTPKGKRGWWYGLWAIPPEEDPDIGRVRAPSSACPRISPKYLERERRVKGPWWYGQEYDAQFQDAITAAFRSEDIDAAFAGNVAFDADLFAS